MSGAQERQVFYIQCLFAAFGIAALLAGVSAGYGNWGYAVVLWAIGVGCSFTGWMVARRLFADSTETMKEKEAV